MNKSIGIFDEIKISTNPKMKRFLTTLSIICVFLFGVGSLAGASNTSKTTVATEKSSTLNSLKNVHYHLMNNGHLIRLEFKKPVSQWMKPVFYEKSVEINFPGAFVVPSTKSFPVESSIISRVFASQSDGETLRVRFQTKPGLKDIQNRIKLLQQGRFIIIRFSVVGKEPSFIYSEKVSPEKKQKENFISIDDDLLSPFLPHVARKTKDKQEEKLAKLNTSTYSSTVKQKETLVIKKEDKNKIKHVERRIVPLADQIKKAIFVFGVIFLVIFCFKKYLLKDIPRVRGGNRKRISPDHSEEKRNKAWSVAFRVAKQFFSYLSRISKPKDAQSVEETKKQILQKIRKLKKTRV